jgi:hypothetical protein
MKEERIMKIPVVKYFLTSGDCPTQLTTWQNFPTGTLRATIARYLCDKFIGHDFANGEVCWGICDGTETRWCRWCNQSFSVRVD